MLKEKGQTTSQTSNMHRTLMQAAIIIITRPSELTQEKLVWVINTNRIKTLILVLVNMNTMTVKLDSLQAECIWVQVQDQTILQINSSLRTQMQDVTTITIKELEQTLKLLIWEASISQ